MRGNPGRSPAPCHSAGTQPQTTHPVTAQSPSRRPRTRSQPRHPAADHAPHPVTDRAPGRSPAPGHGPRTRPQRDARTLCGNCLHSQMPDCSSSHCGVSNFSKKSKLSSAKPKHPVAAQAPVAPLPNAIDAHLLCALDAPLLGEPNAPLGLRAEGPDARLGEPEAPLCRMAEGPEARLGEPKAPLGPAARLGEPKAPLCRRAEGPGARLGEPKAPLCRRAEGPEAPLGEPKALLDCLAEPRLARPRSDDVHRARQTSLPSPVDVSRASPRPASLWVGGWQLQSSVGWWLAATKLCGLVAGSHQALWVGAWQLQRSVGGWLAATMLCGWVVGSCKSLWEPILPSKQHKTSQCQVKQQV